MLNLKSSHLQLLLTKHNKIQKLCFNLDKYQIKFVIIQNYPTEYVKIVKNPGFFFQSFQNLSFLYIFLFWHSCV